MENTLTFTDMLLYLAGDNVLEELLALEEQDSVRKSPLYNRLADALYITGNELLLVKYDFLSGEERQEEWLADEEYLGEEPPLYFSADSHRESPLTSLRRAREFYARFFPAPTFTIHLLLVCNYTLKNYDEMLLPWRKMGATVVHEVKDELVAFPKSPALGRHTETESSEEDDEFMRLLDEFINSEIDAGTETDEQPEEETPETSDESYSLMAGCFETDRIELYRCASGKEDERMKRRPLKSFDRKDLQAVEALISVNYALRDRPEGYFEILLYNDTGIVLAQNRQTGCYQLGEPGSTSQVSLQIQWDAKQTGEWKEGRYLVEIRYVNSTLSVLSFTVGHKNVEGILLGQKEKFAHVAGAFEKLERMTGLQQVKDQIKRYRARVCMAQQRESKGLKTPMPALHAAFMGSPGTGKTTVASLYGKMLKELGLLSKGHLVCEKRSTLMGQNYASEQEKTLAAIEKAKGGVLFIDEAYLLYKPEDPKDPGKNVIETLLTEMGGEKDHDWALLLAGYTEEMNAFLTANPGFDSRIPRQNRYQFADYTVDELMAIADSYCETNGYFLTAEARTALRSKVQYDYNRRDKSFGNGRYIIGLLADDILQSMSVRLSKVCNPSLVQLMTIVREDIPSVQLKDYAAPMKKLQAMVGLEHLKQNIERHLNMVRMLMLRNEQGIHTEVPPLHMVFVGNPGTGKTTVADLIGEIYASLGLLSVGNVVRVERKDLVGACEGETEQKTAEVLKRAKGNVLFIDEAYTLYGGNPNDYGKRVIEALLSVLERDHIDMLVILAGYPEEMQQMLQANAGLKSRIPYTFHFEDYTADELLEIAKGVAARLNYRFTAAALKALRVLVNEKLTHPTPGWGNARFITRLITNTIIPAMGERLQHLPSSELADKRVLLTIRKCDIPSTDEGRLPEASDAFDEEAVKAILERLDALVGLNQVKQHIHNFVKTARHLHRTGRSYADYCSLRWNFTGHTGTGKSTVASMMGELLKAMNILDKGHLVELKAEEFCNAPEYKSDEILRSAMLRSQQGLLFIDGDASPFARPDSRFNSEELRFKLSSMMAELPGAYALVIAEHESKQNPLTQSLRSTGLPGFNHTFYFEDYTEEELFRILEQCLHKKNLCLSERAGAHLADYLHGLCSRRELDYGNARTMKLIADAIAESCWQRGGVGAEGHEGEVLWEDVRGFIWKDFPRVQKVGFK